MIRNRESETRILPIRLKINYKHYEFVDYRELLLGEQLIKMLGVIRLIIHWLYKTHLLLINWLINQLSLLEYWSIGLISELLHVGNNTQSD